MKFARYLEDTQTPEWKRAYIDYRRLKRLISAISQSREAAAVLERSGVTESPEPHPSGSDQVGQQAQPHVTSNTGAEPQQAALSHKVDSLTGSGALSKSSAPTHSPSDAQSILTATTVHIQEEFNVSSPSKHAQTSSEPGNDRRPLHRDTAPKRGSTFLRPSNSSSGSRHVTFASPLTLQELLPLLTPKEQSFFTALDAELTKVESFYLDREREAQVRSKMLEEQLDELAEHRRLYHATHPDNAASWSTLVQSATLRARLPFSRIEQRIFHRANEIATTAEAVQRHSYSDGETDRTVAGYSSDEAKLGSRAAAGPSNSAMHRINASATAIAQNERVLDPDQYYNAKKKLKRAIQEHYRVLELLNNYRILNITGFRKALKKFEKVTKIPAMQAYMHEKVEPSAFASGDSVSAMTKNMEELFTARFENGNKKKAMENLRETSRSKSHHLSTFCSGLILGVSLPALASGLYQSFQKDVRAAIPGWDTLLFVYGVFLIPVLFSLLVGLNILVWSTSRINYIFIFEFDVRTRISSRQYFWIPSFLLATLFYAFWLSFSHVHDRVSPTTWPLVWLCFTAFVLVNPLPVFFRDSRWWLLKILGKMFLSGIRRVEFADFWMGDQLCSLVFTLSNLYLVGCAYSTGFEHALERCGATFHSWLIPFALAALPLWFRFVQSVKRYIDSELITHLVNAGKYASGIVSYLFYFYWRHRGHPSSLVLWCFFNTFYALYAASWDILMDWSLLRPRAKYRFLRSEVVYDDHVPMYHFAIVSNILLRFVWVFYIPIQGPSTALRSFIGALLEMLRRLQWNFYRLENEHLGNMDQYRVTREVPLPYSHDELVRESDKEDNSDENRKPSRKWLKRTRAAVAVQHQTRENEIRLD